MKKLLLLLAIAGCGGGHEVIFLPDASNAPCGLGTWELKDLDESGGIFAFGQSPTGEIWLGAGRGVYILK